MVEIHLFTKNQMHLLFYLFIILFGVEIEVIQLFQNLILDISWVVFVLHSLFDGVPEMADS